MKAPLTLSSAIEKAIITLAFLPVLVLVYPEPAAAATAQNTLEEKALVFEVSTKTKPQEEENPTLSNPCYPAPADSCNPDANVLQQPIVQAQLASITKATPGYTGKLYSKEEVEQLIIQYSAEYGINSDAPRCIAFHESGYNQFSKNKRSTASGVYQYLSSTWKYTDEGKAGLNVFDAEANVKAGVKYMAIHKNTQPWVVRSKCPKIAFVK